MNSRIGNLNKIVILYGQLIGAGGAERVAIEEAEYFAKRLKTKLLTFRAKEEALFDYKDLTELEVLRWNSDEHNYMKLSSSLSRVIVLRRRLNELSPDIVIGCCWAGWLELYLATLFTSIPYILHMHGSMFWFDKDLMKYALIHKSVFNEIRESVMGHKEFIICKPRCGFLQYIKFEVLAFLDYFAVRRAKVILVLSNRVRWEVRKLYNKDAIVLRIGPIPSQILSYTPKQNIKEKLGLRGEKVILSVSRLDPRKRIDLLIKAFAVLSNEMKDTVLVIGGKGPDEGSLKKLAKDLGVRDRIKFVGFIDEEELRDYYAACDVFAYPGWADFAITVYEALALQKNVVCSTEMEIDQRILATGRVFPADPSVGDFVEALKKALTAEIKTKIDLGDYTWDKYFNRIRFICEECLK